MNYLIRVNDATEADAAAILKAVNRVCKSRKREPATGKWELPHSPPVPIAPPPGCGPDEDC